VSHYLWAVVLLLACLRTHADETIDLAQYRGHVVYLDFWASWCAPCQQSFPWLQRMKESYQKDGLAVVAVDLARNRIDADRFLAKWPVDFEIRFDPLGQSAERFNVKGMPTALIIDRHGVTRFTHTGFRPIDGSVYETQLRQVLAEK
jgi:cytochrome c biogenesis protein CcmG, thiol:disulfide interchange protein DsbE